MNEFKILSRFINQHLNKDDFLRHDFEEKNWNNKPICIVIFSAICF